MFLIRTYLTIVSILLILSIVVCISENEEMHREKDIIYTRETEGVVRSSTFASGCCISLNPKFVDNYYGIFDIVSWPFRVLFSFIAYFFQSFFYTSEYDLSNNLCKIPSEQNNPNSFIYKTTTQSKITQIAAMIALYFTYYKPNIDPASLDSGFFRLDNNTVAATNSTSWEKVGCFQPAEFITAMAVRDPVNKVIVVGFRGTFDSLASQDWYTNYKLWRVPNIFNLDDPSQPTGPGEVHYGWLLEMKNFVLTSESNYTCYADMIKAHIDMGYHFVFTGHSQGSSEASIAALHAIWLSKKDINTKNYFNVSSATGAAPIQTILFANPRTGDRGYAELVETHIPHITRFRTGTDSLNQDWIDMYTPYFLGWYQFGILDLLPCTAGNLNCHKSSNYYNGYISKYPTGNMMPSYADLKAKFG